jgi:alkylation response protein AidB-like acyl-CoA dehydrogenase
LSGESEELRAYRESFRTFLARRVVPSYREWASIPRELFQIAGGDGFLAMAVPEEFGGPGVEDVRFGVVLWRRISSWDLRWRRSPARGRCWRSRSSTCVSERDDGWLSDARAAALKLHCPDLYGDVVDAGLQLHGGYGYMAEYPISRAYADARFWRLTRATSERLKDRIADVVLG